MDGSGPVSETYRDGALYSVLDGERIGFCEHPGVEEELGEELTTLVLKDKAGSVEKVMAQMALDRPGLRKAVFDFVRSKRHRSWALRDDISLSSVDSSCEAARFREPPVCEGRDNLITQVLRVVLGEESLVDGPEKRCVILHGEGGIGKSTVALEVLHHKDVRARFGGRRYFVTCDGVTTLGDLLGCLGRQLKLDTSSQNAEVSLCKFAAAKPAILVLDNFEDLESKDGHGLEVEDFLSKLLSAGAHFRLIITKRGTVQLNLRAADNQPVRALDPDAAAAAFVRYAAMRSCDIETSEPQVRDLVERLDCYPLAIMLLAHQLDYEAGIDVQQLLRRYEEAQAAYLQRDKANSPRTSLKFSADLSFSSPAMSVAGAKELCVLLSLVPDGADNELIEHYAKARQWDRFQATTAVIRVGLASRPRGPKNVLRMLAPLRDHVASMDGIEPSARGEACALVLERVKYWTKEWRELFWQTPADNPEPVCDRVDKQSKNFGLAILRLLDSKEREEVCHGVRLAIDLATFIWTVNPYEPGFLTKALDRARAFESREGEAGCLRILGAIKLELRRIPEARLDFEKARDLFTSIGDSQGTGSALIGCGHAAGRSFPPDGKAALSNLTEALRLFERIEDKRGKALALRCLGGYWLVMFNITWAQDSLRTARNHLEEATNLFDEVHDPFGKEYSARGLADAALLQDDLDIAMINYAESLRLSEQTGNKLGQARSSYGLGEIALRKKDLPQARAHFEIALDVATQIHHRDTQVSARKGLNDVDARDRDLHATGRVDESRERSHDAEIETASENATEPHQLPGAWCGAEE